MTPCRVCDRLISLAEATCRLCPPCAEAVRRARRKKLAERREANRRNTHRNRSTKEEHA